MGGNQQGADGGNTAGGYLEAPYDFHLALPPRDELADGRPVLPGTIGRRSAGDSAASVKGNS